MTASNANPVRDSLRLLQLCLGYFLSYAATGIAVKYFTGISPHRLSELGFLVNNTAGSAVFVFLAIFAFGWHHQTLPLLFSRRSWLVIVSGLCTAVVIPTTTLMYLLPISVMVAMIIMRGSVIIVSRVVDAVQIRQGILKKHVTWEEELSVVFALLAISMNLFFGKSKDFDFLQHPTALIIMAFYISAYSIRIYIMNYFKNTAGKLKLENRTFFTIEQCWASFFMITALVIITIWVQTIDSPSPALREIVLSAAHPVPTALVSGFFYAAVAFFSVAIFMFRGRTATFAGVLNRVTSLLAGTASTLLMAWFFGSHLPSAKEWVSFFFIGVATALLARSEMKRA